MADYSVGNLVGCSVTSRVGCSAGGTAARRAERSVSSRAGLTAVRTESEMVVVTAVLRVDMMEANLVDVLADKLVALKVGWKADYLVAKRAVLRVLKKVDERVYCLDARTVDESVAGKAVLRVVAMVALSETWLVDTKVEKLVGLMAFSTVAETVDLKAV